MKNLCLMNLRKVMICVLAMFMGLQITACTEEQVDEEVADDITVTEDLINTEDDDMGDVSSNVVAVGEGETVFTFTVTFEDATMHIYEVSTDAATVGEALVEVGLIEGEDSEYGMFVNTVDGVTLDWDSDAAYWAFYIDGDMAMSGVDTTDIVEGSTYTFAYAE